MQVGWSQRDGGDTLVILSHEESTPIKRIKRALSSRVLSSVAGFIAGRSKMLGSTQVVSPSTADFVQPFMQPFFELSLIALAGTFKLGLYFVVRRQLTSGRLVFYMREQRALRAKVQDDWRRFRQDAAGGTASGGPEQR